MMADDETLTLLAELEEQAKKAADEILRFKKKEKGWADKNRRIRESLSFLIKKIEEFTSGK